MKRSRDASELTAALLRYVEERAASISAARHDLGVGELDARALLYVAEHPGIRPSLLREHLGITSAGMTTLIDRLEAKNAIRRDTDPDDRRASRVTATVDLDAEPWQRLTAFDRRFEQALSTVSSDDIRRSIAVITATTALATGAERDSPRA